MQERYEVLEQDVAGRTRRVRVDGHQVQLDHMDSSDLLLASCYQDGQPCQANQVGLCSHSLEALFYAARVAKVGITTCLRRDAAELLAERLGGRVVCCFRSGQDSGQSRQWVVAGGAA